MTGRDMQPPWMQFPHVPPGSVGWRMGPAEEYYDEFYKWYCALENANQIDYELNNPEPRGWNGFYQRMRNQPWT